MRTVCTHVRHKSSLTGSTWTARDRRMLTYRKGSLDLSPRQQGHQLMHSSS